MKSNLAWHSGLFTSDLPTAKILLKIWRGFGSLGWAAAAQLKLFCLRKLINDCCHERWRGNLGSSARCWGRWAKPFRRGDLHHFTLLGDRTLGHSDPTENQSELRFSLAVPVRCWVLLSFCESSKLWAPLFWVLRMAPPGLALQRNGVGMITQPKKVGAFQEAVVCSAKKRLSGQILANK